MNFFIHFIHLIKHNARLMNISTLISRQQLFIRRVDFSFSVDFFISINNEADCTYQYSGGYHTGRYCAMQEDPRLGSSW